MTLELVERSVFIRRKRGAEAETTFIFITKRTGSAPCSVPSMFTLGKYNVEIIHRILLLALPPSLLSNPYFYSLDPILTFEIHVVDFFFVICFTIAKQTILATEGIDDIEGNINIDFFFIFYELMWYFLIILFFFFRGRYRWWHDRVLCNCAYEWTRVYIDEKLLKIVKIYLYFFFYNSFDESLED